MTPVYHRGKQRNQSDRGDTMTQVSNQRTSSPTPTVSFKTWIGVLGTILGAFMAVLDIQITNASLQDIQAALGATLEEGSWISTAYLVAEIVVIPLTGWLSQVFSISMITGTTGPN